MNNKPTFPANKYDMTFVPEKGVKGQAIANFIADHTILESSKLYKDIPDEVFKSNITSDHRVWQLYFNSAARCSHKGTIIAGVGVVLIDPYGHLLPGAYLLIEPCSNNVAEYNTLIIGLQLAQDMGVKYLEAHGDSKLFVNQIKGEYEVGHNDLLPYHEAALKLAHSIEGFYIYYVARLENTYVDACFRREWVSLPFPFQNVSKGKQMKVTRVTLSNTKKMISLSYKTRTEVTT